MHIYGPFIEFGSVPPLPSARIYSISDKRVLLYPPTLPIFSSSDQSEILEMLHIYQPNIVWKNQTFSFKNANGMLCFYALPTLSKFF